MDFCHLILSDPNSTLTKKQEKELKQRMNVLFPPGSFRCKECGNAVTKNFNKTMSSKVFLLCGFCNDDRLEPYQYGPADYK